MNKNIGELAVKITSNSAAFIKGLEEAQKQSKSFGDSVKKAGVIAASALGGLTVYIGKVTQDLAYMKASAEAIAMTTDEFQEMAYAFSTLGVSIEDTTDFLSDLNDHFGEVIREGEGIGEYGEIFQRLGVSIADANGKIKPTAKILDDLVKAMGDTENKSEALHYSISLFGDMMGRKFINFVNKGTGSLKTLREEAHTYGAVIDEDMIKKCAKASEELNTLTARLEANTKALAAEGSGIVKFGTWALDWLITKTREAGQGYNAMWAGQGDAAYTTDILNEKLRAELDTLDELRDEFANPPAMDFWESLFGNPEEAAREWEKTMMEKMAEIQKRVDRWRAAIAAKESKKETGGGTTETDNQGEANKRLSKTQQDLVKTTLDLIEPERKLRREIAELNKLVGKEGGLTSEQYNAAVKELTDQYNKLHGKITDVKDEFVGPEMPEYIKQLREMGQTISDELNPYDVLIRKLKEIDAIVKAGGLDPMDAATKKMSLIDEYNAKLDETADMMNKISEEQKLFEDMAEQAGNTIAGSFEDMCLRAEKFGDILEGLARQLLKMMMQKMITQPLANAITGGIMGMASGGPISSGTPYLVGEKGPELIIPSTSGNVIPLNKGGGGSKNVQVSIHNEGTPQKVTKSTARQDMNGMIVDIVTSDISRGGNIADTLQGAYGLNRKGGR